MSFEKSTKTETDRDQRSGWEKKKLSNLLKKKKMNKRDKDHSATFTAEKILKQVVFMIMTSDFPIHETASSSDSPLQENMELPLYCHYFQFHS